MVGNKKSSHEIKVIIGGLILASIPRELEQIRFVLSLEDQTVWHGLATGIFLGVRIIGVCIFAYGIAYFAEKTAIVKGGEKLKRMIEMNSKENTDIPIPYSG